MATELSKSVAKALLEIEAVKLQPSTPFTWASGWKSPIYCDNRKTLSYPNARNLIKKAFAEQVKAKYPEVDVIAGVATGAIALGALVADEMDLPMIYIRSSAKAHGMGNQIEGAYKAGQKVVVIEDLVSTGGSSLKAVEALREAGMEVLGMMAIFTYGFAVADTNFKQANVTLDTLSDYNALVELAVEEKYATQNELESLKEWRSAPDVWGK